MAALVKIWVPDPERFEAVNVGGLVNALAAARAAGARLVYTSSFMALGPSGAGALDAERLHPGPPFRNRYERTKARADAVAREAAAGGQDVVTLYPGVIYGPGDMTDGNIVARMIADHLNGRLPGLVGPGDRRWSYAFVEDVAEGHALALEKGRAGDRFVLGGENATLAQLFGLVREIAGVPPPAPADPLRRRLRPRAGAVAVGRDDRPPAAAHARRGRRLPRGVGLRQHEGGARARLRVAAARRGAARDGALAARPGARSPGGARLVSLERGELARRVVHVGCVAFALLLRWLTWWQAALLALAAFLFNWQVLPRVGGKGMWRGADVARGYPVGHPRLPARRARPRPALPGPPVDGRRGLGHPRRGRRDGLARGPGGGRPAPPVERAQGLGRLRRLRGLRHGRRGVPLGLGCALAPRARRRRTGRARSVSPAPSPSPAPSSSRSPRRSTTT